MHVRHALQHVSVFLKVFDPNGFFYVRVGAVVEKHTLHIFKETLLSWIVLWTFLLALGAAENWTVWFFWSREFSPAKGA